MSEKFTEKIEILDNNKVIIVLDATGTDDNLLIRNPAKTIRMNGKTGVIKLNPTNQNWPTILLDGENGIIRFYTKPGLQTISINGESGSIGLGGNGAAGDIFLKNKAGSDTIQLDGDTGNLYLGGNGADGDIYLKNKDGKITMYMDGQTGDIILQNADCAEDFDITETEQIEPGSVMVLNHEGKLEQSNKAYDKKVAGVISGAGDYKPGVVLDKKPGQKNRKPVAMVGKVYCKVDAQSAPIEVGDLLTTSSTPGHAMKAIEPLKAFGAVIGKALKPLESGRGLIPILVALQ